MGMPGEEKVEGRDHFIGVLLGVHTLLSHLY